MRKFTIKQVYEAIEKNGYNWTTNTFMETYGDKIYACAIGQAALNLGVEPNDLHAAMRIDEDYISTSLAGNIEDFNDTQAMNYKEVVEFAKTYLEPYFDLEIEIL